ncbi:tubulin alpha-4 chain isoform X2 [Culex quinquefasciatus]|nr:tubulin alpha-4 chain isoform X2 [Culex quinquefasciatus]
MEHGIYPDGRFCDCSMFDDCSAFFSCDKKGRCVPRVVMIDLEPSVIDEIRIGAYRHLFHPSTLITGKEDASSNFARGHFSLGRMMIDTLMNRVRKVAEGCSTVQGFMLFHSLGGGTGSGLGTLALEKLNDEYGKTSKIEFNIFPSPRISPVIVEPYNAVLSTHAGMEYSDCSILLDNEALYDVCDRSLNVTEPTYTNLNRLIAQIVSCVTSSLRFSGAINVDLLEFQTNLVPYPRIHYPLVTYSPLIPFRNANHEQLTTHQITYECFEPGNQLVKCDPRSGKYISCCMLYRGDVSPVDINRSIQEVKAKSSVNFVDWCPTGFKIGINYQAPISVPGGDLAKVDRAVCMLSNSTAVKSAWERIATKYDLLYERKVFFHHFLDEGLEESDLCDAKENMTALICDYQEVEK